MHATEVTNGTGRERSKSLSSLTSKESLVCRIVWLVEPHPDVENLADALHTKEMQTT